MSDAVVSRLLRNARVLDWLPVVLLPPVLVGDAAWWSADAPPVSPLGVLTAVIACLPLVLRRHVGFAVLAPLLTAGILLVLWQLHPGNTVVVIPMVALAELAASGRPRRSLWMGLTVMPCVVVSVVPFTHDKAELVQIVVRNVALCLLALAGGELVRHRREAFRRAIAAQEDDARRRLSEERLRIAREVHDVVAHSMVAINVQAGVAAHLLDREPEQARQSLLHIKRASKEALDDLRSTLGVLREPARAAPVGPTAGLHDVDELADGLRSAGVRVSVDVDPLAAVPAAVQATGYRIVQEALTNVMRHANASCASVRVQRDDGAVRIEVTDDGAAGAADGDGSGNGLRGMRERAAALGGTLEAGVAAGRGWRVRACLPVADGRETAR